LVIFALAGSSVIDLCKKHQMAVVHEGFSDRRYQAINQLRSRTLEGAVLHQSEEVLTQIEGFLKQQVTLHDKTIVPIQVDSICLHSDTMGAVALSKTIYQFLKQQDVRISTHS